MDIMTILDDALANIDLIPTDPANVLDKVFSIDYFDEAQCLQRPASSSGIKKGVRLVESSSELKEGDPDIIPSYFCGEKFDTLNKFLGFDGTRYLEYFLQFVDYAGPLPPVLNGLKFSREIIPGGVWENTIGHRVSEWMGNDPHFFVKSVFEAAGAWNRRPKWLDMEKEPAPVEVITVQDDSDDEPKPKRSCLETKIDAQPEIITVQDSDDEPELKRSCLETK